MAKEPDKISMDIDLSIDTDHGSISVENTSTSSLLVNISNGRTLREVLRKRGSLQGMLQSGIGQSVVPSVDTKVTVDGKVIALFEGDKVSQAKRFYLGWQYLLAKLGI